MNVFPFMIIIGSICHATGQIIQNGCESHDECALLEAATPLCFVPFLQDTIQTTPTCSPCSFCRKCSDGIDRTCGIHCPDAIQCNSDWIILGVNISLDLIGDPIFPAWSSQVDVGNGMIYYEDAIQSIWNIAGVQICSLMKYLKECEQSQCQTQIAMRNEVVSNAQHVWRAMNDTYGLTGLLPVTSMPVLRVGMDFEATLRVLAPRACAEATLQFKNERPLVGSLVYVVNAMKPQVMIQGVTATLSWDFADHVPINNSWTHILQSIDGTRAQRVSWTVLLMIGVTVSFLL